MAVIRVEKTKDYTVMSNHHLRNPALSLKAKGLLSQILSLPEGWDYTIAGLAKINKEGEAAISTALKELKEAGYVVIHQTYDAKGCFSSNEYVIFEHPVKNQPLGDFPVTDDPAPENPDPENRGQLSTDKSSKDLSKRKNKKEKSRQAEPELTLEEVKPLLVENIVKMSKEGGWSTEVMNQIYTALVDFYSPRAIKGNKSPPVKSARGINGLCNKLMRESKGNPHVILNALDDAISAGWTTAHPKPDGRFSQPPPQKRGREYEEV